LTREGRPDLIAGIAPPELKSLLFFDGRLFFRHMAYFVYILQSERDGSYYIGHTADLEDRLRRHNEGRIVYTRAKAPWKLIHQETFESRSDAMKREKEIKAKKVRDYIEHLVRTPRV
jgi:putative endonuclease